MTQERRYDLDWLRVLAFGLLMFYHTGMAFVGWDFHLYSPDLLPELRDPMIFMNQWRLPLLFAISGAGTWFALRRRSHGAYAQERVKRLLLPLIFGMLFIVPPQIYVEYLALGKTEMSYGAFQLSVFAFVPYPMDGALSWHHLWFVLYLFCFSLLALPLFAYVRGETGAHRLEALRQWLARSPWHMAAPLLLLWPVYNLLDPRFPETHALIDDPAALLRYFLLFLAGFVFLGSNPLRAAMREHRGVLLIVAASAFVCQRLLVYEIHFIQGDMRLMLYQTLKMIYCWFAIMTIAGYAVRYLNRSHPVLAYANQAVYPFYILHQTVLLILLHMTMTWNMGPWLRLLFLMTAMFGICFLLYEFVIRRVSALRPLFGLKTENVQTRRSVMPIREARV